jgi:hypothetical protein
VRRDGSVMLRRATPSHIDGEPHQSGQQFVAVQESAHDAVDGSSTGTRVPKMWALLKAPTIRRS